MISKPEYDPYFPETSICAASFSITSLPAKIPEDIGAETVEKGLSSQAKT